MGRFNFTQTVVNPAARTYQWHGAWLDDNDKPIPFESRFSYWHKDEEKPENSERVAVKPFSFSVLGFSMAVGGYDQTAKKGIYSNEVNYDGTWNATVSKNVVVKMEGNVVFEGSIKDALEHNNDFKRVINVYLYNYDTKQIERWTTGAGQPVVRSMLFGQDQFKGVDLETAIFSITNQKQEKTGTTKYALPVIEVVGKTDEKQLELLDSLADTVNEYLNSRFVVEGNTMADVKDEESESETTEDSEIDLTDVPF